MKYRRAGETGLQVSEVGFGCGGNAGLMLKGTASERRRVIARAIELGINYFDNSPDYGDGTAEENLGGDLKALGVFPVVATKVEVRQANLADVAGHVVRSVEGSLRRLQRDCVDILQIHNGPSRGRPEQGADSYSRLALDDFLGPRGALEGLQRIVRDGKARHIGFVCRGNDGDEVRELLRSGVFHMINLPYTLMNPTAGRIKPEGLVVEQDFGAVIHSAKARGVGVAVYSPLAGGFLTDQCVAGKPRHPHALQRLDPASGEFERRLTMARALSFLSQHGRHTYAQAAMRFVLMHPGVTVVLGGFSDKAQLEEAVPAACEGPLAPDLMEQVEQVWRQNFGLP